MTDTTTITSLQSTGLQVETPIWFAFLRNRIHAAFPAWSVRAWVRSLRGAGSKIVLNTSVSRIEISNPAPTWAGSIALIAKGSRRPPDAWRATGADKDLSKRLDVWDEPFIPPELRRTPQPSS